MGGITKMMTPKEYQQNGVLAEEEYYRREGFK
jgi:hypothetical protein